MAITTNSSTSVNAERLAFRLIDRLQKYEIRCHFGGRVPGNKSKNGLDRAILGVAFGENDNR
jgi:hypothetical protein